MLGTERVDRSRGLLPLVATAATVLGLGLVAFVGGTAAAGDNRLALVSIAAGGALAVWLLHAGLNLRRSVALAIVLLILSPGIRLSPRLPVVFGDDFIIFAVGGLLLVSLATGQRQSVSMGLAPTGIFLALFIPMTAISMMSGYLGFDIVPTKGGLFEFVKVAKYVLAFYIASHVRLESRHLKSMSTLLVGVITLSAIFGLAQAFDLSGAREFSSNFFFAIARDSDTGELHQNMLGALSTRAAGTVGNPNLFGLLVGVGLVFAVAMLLARTFRGAPLALLLSCTAVMTVGLVVAGSRTAIVAVLAALAYLLVTDLFRRRRLTLSTLRSRRRVGLRMFAIAAALVIVVLIVGQRLPGTQATIVARLSRISNFDFQQVPIQRRLEIVEMGLDQAAGSPLLGYGPAEGRPEFLHSVPLDVELVFVLLRYGVVGLFLFAVFWFSAFRLARSLLRIERWEAKMFGRAVAALIVLNVVATFAAGSLFDIRRMTLTCLLLGLCVAVRSAFGPMAVGHEQTPARTHGLR